MAALDGRRIELWVEARDGKAAVNPTMQALLHQLEALGAITSVRVPEHELIDPEALRQETLPDLVLLKSATTLALSLAIADEAYGVKFLNTARATLRAHDKAATAARLAAAGLPDPATYFVDQPLLDVPASCDMDGDWVSKPTRGVHGHGVTFHPRFEAAVTTRASVDQMPGYVVDDGTRLVQRRIGRDQADMKVYVAAERCFAGRKSFSATSYASNKVEICDLNQYTTDIVLAAGEALELRCFGVDLRFEDEQPYLIDVNPFPGYRGFPDAVAALRGEIERALEADR